MCRDRQPQNMQALDRTLKSLDDFVNIREIHWKDLSKQLTFSYLWF